MSDTEQSQPNLRIVFDTNIVVSAIASAGGLPARLLVRGLMGEFELVLSEHILTETERTLLKPYFLERLSSEDREGVLAFLRAEVTIIPITADVQDVAPSSDDDLVLATAVSADAQYLATGDRGLLAIKDYQKVQIVNARELLAILT